MLPPKVQTQPVDYRKWRQGLKRFGVALVNIKRFKKPKTLRVRGMGRGYPLLNRLEGLGSVVSFPSRVRGRAPENGYWCIFSLIQPYDDNKFDTCDTHRT